MKTADVFSVDHLNTVCVITIHARELNNATSEELSSGLLTLLNQAKTYRYVLDFEQVVYMESCCFSALVTFLKWLARFDGKIALANVSQNVRFLFNITKLDQVFPIHRTLDSAIKSVES